MNRESQLETELSIVEWAGAHQLSNAIATALARKMEGKWLGREPII
jgi:hypothetical protein